MTSPAAREELGLILAPRGRDAAVIAEVLQGRNISARICAGGAELITELNRGAGFVMLSEEALSDIAPEQLAHWIDRQSAWSDLPFIVFASRQGSPSIAALRTLETLANLLLLERPVSVQTIAAAATSALRARHRQYQARRQVLDIEETERHLRLALRAGGLGSWELDLASGTFAASELCHACFGYGPEEQPNHRNLLAAVHPDDRREQREAMLAAVEQDSDFNIEFRVFWPDASLHWVQMRGQSVSGVDGIRLAGVCADVTARRAADEALRASRREIELINSTLEARIAERTGELARANDRLMREIGERERTQSALVQAQKMEAVGQLTGGIAHDFNNLLHVVNMNLTLMARVSSDERVLRLIEPARRAVDRGAKLTGQLLAFARSQTLNLQPVDVNSLIRNMSDLLRMSIGEYIPCTLHVGEHETLALADPNQLEMAVLNLAINARDAMPAGGTISIATAVSPDGAEAGESGPCAVITVTDTGTGIAPGILSKVFDPFFTTKPSGKGTGLGLSQVYGFARQCGGSVKIRSELGVGTAVEIWLLLALDKAAQPSAATIPAATANSGARVMVVEDNADVREVIVGGLQALGYAVAQAADGRAGLRAMEETQPDLLIVDYAMPDMNGADVTAKVQAYWPDLPVIIATGYADMRTVERLIGPEAILRKPFDLNTLAHAVRNALARGGGQARPG